MQTLEKHPVRCSKLTYRLYALQTDVFIFELAGITGASTQTGINAGLSMFTWFCQIGAVILGKKFGRRPFLLGVWPMLLLCLAGVCAAL